MKILKTENITENNNKYEKVTYYNGAIVKSLISEPTPDDKLPEPEEPVDTEEVLAEILLNQANIKSKQEEQDEVLAMLLLNSRKGE